MDLAEIERVRAGLPAELQDGDPAKDPGMDAGRNIRAGYARGCGLQYGGLHPVIDSDPDWMAAWALAQGRSIVTHHRLMNIFLIMKYASVPSGNVIEFGSYRGGSALLMAMLAKRLRPGTKVYALDTYEGMPATDDHLDRHRPGSFAGVDLEELEAIKVQFGLDNLFFLKGLFQDTVKLIPRAERRFFLTHVDCDIYESVRFSIDYAKRQAVPGSYIVFDDPLEANCLGSMKAVEEELIRKGCLTEQLYPHLVYRYPPLI